MGLGLEWARVLHGGLFVAVAAAAWARAREDAAHRVIAAVSTLFGLAFVVQLALDRVLDPIEPPYHGSARAAYYASHATVLAFSFALAGGIWVHYRRGRARDVLLAYALTWIGLVAYKESTSDSLVPVHQGIWVIASLAEWGMIVRTIFARAERVAPDGAHLVLALLAASDLVRTVFSFESLDMAWFPLRVVDITVMAGILVGYSMSTRVFSFGRREER